MARYYTDENGVFRKYEEEPVEIPSALLHNRAAGNSSTSLCCLILHPSESLLSYVVGKGFRFGAEACREHLRQYIEVGSRGGVNCGISHSYVFFAVSPCDVLLQDYCLHSQVRLPV